MIETEAAPIFATLFWRGGRIEAEVSQANAFDLWSDTIEVKPTLRTSRTENAFVDGDRASEFGGLPVAGEVRVTSASELSSGRLRLRFERSYLLVNVDTGQILP